MVQFSHLYLTAGKNHSFEVSRVMSLLFNMLSRFVIAFLPRSMHLNFMAAVNLKVVLEPKKIKSATVHTFFTIHLP